MSRRPDVVVIGAGPNGLTLAALLAQAGRSVLVVERSADIGGLAVSDEFHPGFRGAGLFHDSSAVRPAVVRRLGLERHGLRLRDRPAILATDGVSDGLLLEPDLERASAAIAKRSRGDADAYRAYRAFLNKIRGVLEDFIDRPPVDLVDLESNPIVPTLRRALRVRRLGGPTMMELLRLPPMCVADWLAEWFEDDLLRAALAIPAVAGTFMGPRSPGSNLNLLLAEIAAGQAIDGGGPALIASLDAAARGVGVEIRTGAEVARIETGPSGVRGVTLTDGEEILASRVAASCDPPTVLLNLLARGVVPTRLEGYLEQYRMRGTTAHVLLALRSAPRFRGGNGRTIEHARLAAGLDDIEKAFDAVKYRRCSERPVLDVLIPTLADASLAPEGQAVASVLVHFAPYDLEGGWTDENRNALGDRVVETLERHAPGTADAVVARRILAPPDLESRYGCAGGHWHHGEHALDQLMVRPAPGCSGYKTIIPGLFLCGSGSHPGGGLTCAPALHAAAEMLSRRSDSSSAT